MNGIQLEVAYNAEGNVIGWRITAGSDVNIVPANAPALINQPAFAEPAEYHVMYTGRPEV